MTRSKLIDHLSFRSQDQKHELSNLYETKIKNMGNAGRNGGEYYTPRPLIRAMIKVVKPKIGDRIYDGAAGSAGFLCEAYDYLKPLAKSTSDKILRSAALAGWRGLSAGAGSIKDQAARNGDLCLLV